MRFDEVKWDKVIDAEGKKFSLNLTQVWNYRDLISLFVRRDFVINFKQTILGPLWFLIQPICTTIMHIIVFGGLANLSTDGVPQVLFYFAGSMLWSLFSAIVLMESNIFTTNKNIFGKVYFPRLTAVISTALGEVLKGFIQFCLFLLLYVFYAIRGETVGFSWRFFLFIPIVIWIVLLASGIGLIISSITTKYRDVALTLSFFLSLWMYATPVAYPLSQISGKLKMLFLINPVSAPIECFRIACFGAGYVPFISILISGVFTVVVVVAGLVLFSINEKTFVDVI